MGHTSRAILSNTLKISTRAGHQVNFTRRHASAEHCIFVFLSKEFQMQCLYMFNFVFVVVVVVAAAAAAAAAVYKSC